MIKKIASIAGGLAVLTLFWLGSDQPAVAQCTGQPPANVICASPNGSAGLPRFRPQVAADLPGAGIMGGSLTGTFPDPLIGAGAINNSMLSSGSYTAITGIGTITGPGTITGVTITGLANPSAGSDAANKSYVDAATTGVTVHAPVIATTTTVLPFTPMYANGTAGVGATLTAGSPGALIMDGHTVLNGERILVKDQTSTSGCTVANVGCQNGVYTQTTLGTGGVAYVLTRATDMDTVGTGPGMMETNATFLTQSGTVNVGGNFALTTLPTITIGTTGLTFSQNGLSQVYTAGAGLSLIGTSFSVTAPLPVNLGGIGAVTLTGLLQGNGASAITGLGGTSGGIPYFSSVGVVGSSAALTASGLLLGGGAGAAPTAMGRLTAGQIPIGQTVGAPIGAVFSGDVINNAAGVVTIQNNVVTNAKAAQGGAATLKGNPTNATANLSDFTIASLTTLTSPDAVLDYLPIYDHIAGTIKKVNAGSIVASSTGAAGVTGNVQFNTGGSLAADSLFSWDSTLHRLILDGSSGDKTLQLSSYDECGGSPLITDGDGLTLCSGRARNVLGYGALCSNSGTTEDRDALLAARDTPTGYPTVMIPLLCSLRLNANTTFTGGGSKLILPCGAKVYVAAGVTFTINGMMEDPGTCQVFYPLCSSGTWPTGTGCGVIAGLRFVRPEWWGAVGDNSNNDQPALQAAANSVQASASSDGDRPTIALRAGACYSIASTFTVSPSAQIPLRMYGGGLHSCLGNGGTAIIAKNTLATTALIVDGAIPGVGDPDIMNFEMRDFTVEQFTPNATETCIQINSSGKTINGQGRSLFENIWSSGCTYAWRIPTGALLTRLIVFRRIFGDVAAGNSSSHAFFIRSDAGASIGEMEIQDSTFGAGDSIGNNIVFEAVNAGSSVAGIKFTNVNFYAGDLNWWLNASSSGQIFDIFCNACQLDPGTTHQNVGIRAQTASSGSIANINFSNSWISKTLTRALWFTGSAADLNLNNSFINIEIIDTPQAALFSGVYGTIFSNNRLFALNTTNAIQVTNSFGMIITNNTATSSAAISNALVLFDGTTDYSTACMNNTTGTLAAANVAKSTTGTTNNYDSSSANNCFNH